MNLPTEIVMVLGGLLTEAAAKQIKLFAPKNLLAVDQAYTKLLPFGLTPNFVIGDCDSIDKNSLPPGVKLVERDDQDMTDFEKSIHFVREHSWKRVSIFGFGGGELDDILGNVEVLSKSFLNEDEFYFFDYFEDKPKLACIIDKGITFNSFIGAKASLFPCPSAVLGVLIGVHNGIPATAGDRYWYDFIVKTPGLLCGLSFLL